MRPNFSKEARKYIKKGGLEGVLKWFPRVMHEYREAKKSATKSAESLMRKWYWRGWTDAKKGDKC